MGKWLLQKYEYFMISEMYINSLKMNFFYGFTCDIMHEFINVNNLYVWFRKKNVCLLPQNLWRNNQVVLPMDNIKI